ncbi:MAG: cation:proton antiporter [Anaerolineae bacterium]|nr:cation:proton antiporter [Anaerolineae bacterium]
MHNTPSFAPLLIVVLLAAIVPMVTTQIKSVRIPIVVGEIIAGVIVGKSGLNWVGEDPWLSLLSTLGFSYLRFLSGLEVDFDALLGRTTQWIEEDRGRLRSPVLLAFLSFALTLVAAFLLSLGLQSMGLVHDAVLMALILSTTSLGIVVPTLKERREIRTAYGQALLIAALLADFVTMLLISVYVVFRVNGLAPEMLVVLVLLGIFLTAYRVLLLLRRHLPLESLFRKTAEAVGHLHTRGAFAVGLTFIALAEQLGVEVILGAFLGGALIALLSGKENARLYEQLDVMGYGFFIPIFFIMVGVRFDLRSLLSSRQTMLLVPILLAIAYLIKLIPSLVFKLAYDWAHVVGAGVLLSSRLSLIIAAAAIGLELGILDPAVNSAVILLAVITCTLSPALFNRIVPPGDTIIESGVLIVGADQEALQLARRLSAHSEPVMLAWPVSASRPLPKIENVIVMPLEDVSQKTLRAVGADRVKTLVALLDDEMDNLRLCQIAKIALRVPNVVARVQDPANVEAYVTIGARPVTKEGSEVTVLENLASNPNVFTLLAHGAQGREVLELEVRNPVLDGMPVHALHLPGDALLVVIQREGQFITPRGDASLALGDVVTVLASPVEEEDIRALFGEVSTSVREELNGRS